jgi:hypothetical protein
MERLVVLPFVLLIALKLEQGRSNISGFAASNGTEAAKQGKRKLPPSSEGGAKLTEEVRIRFSTNLFPHFLPNSCDYGLFIMHHMITADSALFFSPILTPCMK